MVANNTFIIIQARMTSTRLPGKVMLRLCGKSVLEVMLERLRGFYDHIIIATTNDGTEAPIVALCEGLHVKIFQGSTEDVLNRYYGAATAFGAKAGDTIVRLTSDCPLSDPHILTQALELHTQDPLSYVSVDITQSYPRGMDAEVFAFEWLERAQNEASTSYEREHVTPYIRSLNIRKQHVTCKHNDSHFRLTLDTQEDYEVISKLYEKLECRTDFNYDELRQLLYAHPQITALNAHVEQKTH